MGNPACHSHLASGLAGKVLVILQDPASARRSQKNPDHRHHLPGIAKRKAMFKWLAAVVVLVFIVRARSQANQPLQRQPAETHATGGTNLKTAPPARSIPPAGLGVDL